MVKKLLLSLLLGFMAISSNAQSIGMIGDFTSWSSDVVMDTADNITYTKRQTFLVTGGGSVGSMVDTTDADVLTSVTYIAGGTAGRACHYHNNPKTLKTIISFIFIS